jgi:hypothetical protein
MTLSEKALYHQIHPLKLGTDIGAALASLYFFWRHQLAAGLVVHFAPPVIATILLLAFADLEPQKNSRFGRYVARMMTRPVEAVRLFGDILAIIGAWYQSVPIIVAGFAIILAAWLSGLFPKFAR